MGFRDLFRSRSKKERMSRIKNLVALVAADGKIKPEEMALLSRIARRSGISEGEFRQIIEKPQSVKLCIPKKEEDQIEHLLELVLVMMVDGDIDEREMELCKQIALEFGFNPRIIDKMVDDIVKLIARGIAFHIAIKQIKARISMN